MFDDCDLYSLFTCFCGVGPRLLFPLLLPVFRPCSILSLLSLMKPFAFVENPPCCRKGAGCATCLAIKCFSTRFYFLGLFKSSTWILEHGFTQSTFSNCHRDCLRALFLLNFAFISIYMEQT